MNERLIAKTIELLTNALVFNTKVKVVRIEVMSRIVNDLGTKAVVWINSDFNNANHIHIMNGFNQVPSKLIVSIRIIVALFQVVELEGDILSQFI
jgi:hypothetical protein